MKDPRDIILRPIVSEKSYARFDEGVYTFQVHPDATKPEIRSAIETIFSVKVVKVNTLNRPGKVKFNRRRSVAGRTSATKRAMVTLADGNEIPLFES